MEAFGTSGDPRVPLPVRSLDRDHPRNAAAARVGEPVALDAHPAGQSPGQSPEAVAAWVLGRKPPLEALTEPGDEWRAWVGGTEPLMQTGGLALVRRGRVVWARQDWIS